MADKKTYTIPLRRGFMEKAPKKKTPRALRVLIDYIVRHCKVETVKIGPHLNHEIWSRGIKNPPAKITVDVVIDKDVAKVELAGKEYVEQKVIKKKEEGSLKDKIASKLGGNKEEKTESETPAETPSPVEKTSPPAEKKTASAAKKKTASVASKD